VRGNSLPGLYTIGLGSGYACNGKGIDGEKGKEGQVVPKTDGVDLYVSVYAKPVLEKVLRAATQLN